MTGGELAFRQALGRAGLNPYGALADDVIREIKLAPLLVTEIGEILAVIETDSRGYNGENHTFEVYTEERPD